MEVEESTPAGGSLAEEEAVEAPADPYTRLLRDLRGPVMSIQSYVRTLIARDGTLSSSARATIHQVILQQSRRLDGFVDDVVLYVRLLGRGMTSRPEPTLLAAVADEVRARLGEPERVVIGHGLDVVADVDRFALAGIMRRLIRNGLVYGPRSAKVEVTAGVEDGHVTVYVTDSGPGIPEQATDEAMQPFVRAVRPGERRTDGIGLGLAVSRELARLIGAELELRAGDPGLIAALRLAPQ